MVIGSRTAVTRALLSSGVKSEIWMLPVTSGPRTTRAVAYGIDYEKGAAYASEKSRLRASWRHSNPTTSSMHTLLEVRGRSHYVSNFLQVYSRYQGWWGEGDPTFRIDDKAITHSLIAVFSPFASDSFAPSRK